MKQTLFKFFSLCLLSGLVACSSTHTEPKLQPKQSIHEVVGKPGEVEVNLTLETQSNISSSKEDIHLASNPRALEGLQWEQHWLVPKVSPNNKVNGVLIITDGSETTFTEKEFEYDPETRKVVYKGEIQLPRSAQKGSKLHLRALVAPANWWNKATNKLTIPQQDMVEETNRTNGTQLSNLQVAYMSPWISMTMQTDSFGKPDNNTQLKPVGHIIRITVQNTQGEIPQTDGVVFKQIGIESNTLSRTGSYDFTGAVHTETQTYTPEASERPYGTSTDIYYHTMALDQTSDYRTARTYYLWVHPRAGVKTPHTRGFLQVRYEKPPMDPRLTGGGTPWWLGTATARNNEDKIVVATYSSSDFTSTGSTMNIRLTNLNAFPQISRFTAGAVGERAKSGEPPVMQGKSFTFMEKYADRESGLHAIFTYDEVLNHGLLRAGGVPITVTGMRNVTPFYTNKDRLKWRMPTIGELKLLFPPLHSEITVDPQRVALGLSTSIFQVNSLAPRAVNQKHTDQVNESAQLGNRLSSKLSDYKGEFVVTESNRDYNTIDGIRFSGNGDRYRHFYRYRYLKSGESRTQVQAIYIGPFYPEITTIESWNNYKGVKPSLEETIIGQYNTRWTQSIGNYNFPYGERVWVAELSANGHPQYVEFDFNNKQNRVVEVDPSTMTDWYRYASVWLVRDFGDLE